MVQFKTFKKTLQKLGRTKTNPLSYSHKLPSLGADILKTYESKRSPTELSWGEEGLEIFKDPEHPRLVRT